MDAASDCLMNGGSSTDSIAECYGCIDVSVMSHKCGHSHFKHRLLMCSMLALLNLLLLAQSGFEDAEIPPSCSDVSGSAQYCGARDVCLEQNCESSSCLGKVKDYFNCQYNEIFRSTETSCDICDHTVLPGGTPLSNRDGHSNSTCHNQELNLLSCLSGNSYTNTECVRCDLVSGKPLYFLG